MAGAFRLKEHTKSSCGEPPAAFSPKGIPQNVVLQNYPGSSLGKKWKPPKSGELSPPGENFPPGGWKTHVAKVKVKFQKWEPRVVNFWKKGPKNQKVKCWEKLPNPISSVVKKVKNFPVPESLG